MKSNDYIPFFPMISTTFCPWSAIIAFLDSMLIGLTLLNECMWSYIPLNWARIDQIERYAPLYQVQVVSGNVDVKSFPEKPWKWPTQSALTKILIHTKPPNFFMCSHLKNPRKVPIKGWEDFSQDKKGETLHLSLQVCYKAT
jgi:hypothetical protein